MNKTSIEWTDYTWNPVTGCHKVSQGCKNCYAETIAKRFWSDRKFTDMRLEFDRLNEPIKMINKLRGKKVFVCDVSDLFHDDVPFMFINSVITAIWSCPDTIFQVLTKRIDRALEWHRVNNFSFWPLPNLWLGVSCEDQATADERVPLLLQIPAAVRFLSCEPLLGPIDIVKAAKHPSIYSVNQKINWIIVGGESGHGARPMHPDWVRSLRDQCASAGVPFFFKQWGEYVPTDFSCLDIHAVEISSKKSFHWLRLEDGKLYDSTTIEGHYQLMYKLGKSKSGALLDGIQYREFPSK